VTLENSSSDYHLEIFQIYVNYPKLAIPERKHLPRNQTNPCWHDRKSWSRIWTEDSIKCKTPARRMECLFDVGPWASVHPPYPSLSGKLISCMLLCLD